jgi:hypothetical protein
LLNFLLDWWKHLKRTDVGFQYRVILVYEVLSIQNPERYEAFIEKKGKTLPISGPFMYSVITLHR